MNAKMRTAIVTISASVTKTMSLCMRCFIEPSLNGTILKLVRFIYEAGRLRMISLISIKRSRWDASGPPNSN